MADSENRNETWEKQYLKNWRSLPCRNSAGASMGHIFQVTYLYLFVYFVILFFGVVWWGRYIHVP